MLLSILLTTTLTALLIELFWQPWMSTNYQEPRRRSQKEEYISSIWDLIGKENYEKLEIALQKPSYPLSDLPVEQWKASIYRSKKRIIEDRDKMPVIERLENLLK